MKLHTTEKLHIAVIQLIANNIFENSYRKIINLAENSYRKNGHFAENSYRIGFITEKDVSKKPVFVCLQRQKLISSATHF